MTHLVKGAGKDVQRMRLGGHLQRQRIEQLAGGLVVLGAVLCQILQHIGCKDQILYDGLWLPRPHHAGSTSDGMSAAWGTASAIKSRHKAAHCPAHHTNARGVSKKRSAKLHDWDNADSLSIAFPDQLYPAMQNVLQASAHTHCMD